MVKKILIGLFIIFIVGLFFLDRMTKGLNEYQYREFKQQHTEQIRIVDSVQQKAAETNKQVDYIKEAYESKKDSIEELMNLNQDDQKKLRSLIKQMRVLDEANELVKVEKVRVKEKYGSMIDSLKNEISMRDNLLKVKDNKIEMFKSELIEKEIMLKELLETKMMMSVEMKTENIKEKKKNKDEDFNDIIPDSTKTDTIKKGILQRLF
jgi:gas vesicle protein